MIHHTFHIFIYFESIRNWLMVKIFSYGWKTLILFQQHISLFYTSAFWLSLSLSNISICHLRLACVNSCQLWGTLAAFKLIIDQYFQDEKCFFLPSMNIHIQDKSWSSIDIFRVFFAELLSPGRLSRCLNVRRPRLSCCESPSEDCD